MTGKEVKYEMIMIGRSSLSRLLSTDTSGDCGEAVQVSDLVESWSSPNAALEPIASFFRRSNYTWGLVLRFPRSDLSESNDSVP